jgi:hypothetical protein
MVDSIKITALQDIGANIAYTALVPLVNMAGTPTTQKANLQILGNLILNGAGGSYFPRAAQANLALSVANAAQPNITSVGTLGISTLKISGGVNGYILRTDGSGNLTWIAPTATVSGSNTQVQFNNAGSFGSSANFTYDNGNNILNVIRANASYLTAYESVVTANLSANGLATIARINVTNTANLGAVGNITITGGSNGQVLTTNGNGVLSWTNDANSSYGNSNVVSLLSAFGSNTITTTGNVSVGNIIGNGRALTNIAGANVSGFVPNANVANTAFAVAGANVSGTVGNANLSQYLNVSDVNNNFSYHVVLSAGSGDKSLHIDADDNLQYNPADGTLTATRVDATYVLADLQFSNGYPAANVTGLGNIATINLTGSNSNVLYGNGVFAPAAGGGTGSELVNGNNSFVLDNDGNVVFEGTPAGNAINRGLVWDYGANANGVNSELRQDNAGLTVRAWTEDSGNVAASVNIVTNQDANTNTWIFDGNGNLALPGNLIVPAGNIVTDTLTPAFSSAITGITTGNATVIVTLADLVFGDPYTGTVTISGVTGTTQANGTWGYEATGPNEFQLYTDDTLTTPVDGTTWTAYVSGGNAVGVGTYTDLTIQGGNVSVGSNDKIWTFDNNGNLTLPNTANVSINYADGNSYLGKFKIYNGDMALLYTAGLYDINIVPGGEDYSYIVIPNAEHATLGDKLRIGATEPNSAVQIETAGGNWTFGNTGNLTLPANTFAVNYANGTQVSIGGGSGNTGDVTFSNNIVIGTGDEYGYNGLYLAPGNASIANSAVQYLRVRGGDVATHIHLDTGNNQFYDQYFGADSRYVKLEANGNVVINADDYNGNGATWTLDTTGNLTLAGGNSVIQSIANSSLDILNPNVSTMVLTPDANYNSQALVLDPTGPGHIHLRAPGANIDEPTANLFLGGEDTAFEITEGANNQAVIHSNGKAWTFGNDGNISSDTLTFTTTFANVKTVEYQTAGVWDLYVEDSITGSNTASSRINVSFKDNLIDKPQVYIENTKESDGVALRWTFDENGNLNFPRDVAGNSDPYLNIFGGSTPTIQSTDVSLAGPANLAIVTDYLNLSGSTGEKIVLYADTGEMATDANMTLTTNLANTGNTSSWVFGTTGNLTLPGNLIIAGNTNVFGTDAALIQPTDDKPLIALSSGANGAVSSLWVEDIGNVGTSNIAAVYANPTVGSKIVRIAVGQNGGNAGPNLWDFNSNGTTIFPGDLIGSGASPAPSISGFNSANFAGNVTGAYILGNGSQLTSLPAPTVSQDITSNGAMSIMTYDGNLKYVSYATVEPSSGNIAGGNISASGNISATNLSGNGGNITYQQTNTFYVDPGRTQNYTPSGSQIQPFFTITAAIAAAQAAGYDDTDPAFIILMENITEDVTLKPGIWLTSLGTGTHGSPNITGTVTVTSSTGTLSSNHYSISNLRIVAPSGGHGILFTGTAPQRLFVRDMWIEVSGTGTGDCIYTDNTGTGSTLHMDIAHLAHNGSGDVYCINVTKGNCYVTNIETTGSTQVAAVQTGAVMTIDGSELDANGDVVCETYGTGSLTITNSIITNIATNSNGIKINDAGSTVTVGQCLFSIPAGTGSVVYYNPAATLLGSNFAFASISFFPGTNTTVDARLLPIPLTVAVGTIAAPIIVGDITATGTAQDWDLIDNNASALSFDTTGKAGIINLVTTNGAEGVTMSGYANVTGNMIAGNLMGPLANGNSNVTIATAAGNVVTNVNGSAILTVYSGGIKVGGSGVLQSPGGAGSITLNNNGANIPTANITNTLNVTGAGGANITGNLTAGNISATGNITAGNIYATNIVAEASFSIQTANFNANVGGRYGVNTTSGAVTSTLPASPSTGGAIFFADAGGAFASNNLTINPNGQTIMGASGNMTVSNNNQSFGLFFNGATWRTYN